MASIRENRKNGKIISYTFTACLGRDENGKQIRHYINWTPPKGIGPAKAPKEAAKQAALWEESLRKDKEPSPAPVKAATAATGEQRRDDFVSFVEKTWFPLQVSGNDRKEKTVQFYEGTTKIIKAFFSGYALQDITAMDIEKYLVYLRTEYKRIQFMYGGKLQKVKFRYTGPDVDAILDRLPTAEILDEEDGAYTISAEVFGTGINMWLRSQGPYVQLIQ